MRSVGIAAAFVLFLAFGPGGLDCPGQAKILPKNAPADYKASPAFAEIRLKKAELEAELEALLLEYTEEYPKVKEIKTSLSLLQKESDRLSNAPGGAQRLTLALGKLMVRKAELETDVVRLLESLQPAHPDVKRAKRKVEIFEAAIKEILG